MVLLILSLLAFMNVNATGSFSNIQTNGTINYGSPLTVILRGVCITSDLSPSGNINAWVDSYVANHTYANAVTLVDMHMYGILWYGYSFKNGTGTWMGWTFQQLATLINRFHYWGWKVGIESTAIAWYGQQEYNYIETQHPELAFVLANGKSAATLDAGTNDLIPDFFANYTTPDTTNNIPAGSRLIDVYTTRLTQMIEGGLHWDFWFGTDGWNGFTNEGYYWDSSTASSCYSFSRQEENEWGNATPASMRPSNWASLNTTARANVIISNSTRLNNWWQYWQIRFAQMYAQIRQAFINAGESNSTFHTIGCADESSEPGNTGILCPAGMWNITDLVNHHAVDYFYVDQEATAEVGATYGLAREEAYVGALVKMQALNAVPIIGLQPVDWLSNVYPEWMLKQSYLAQAENYVWINGTRYRVSSPNVIMMQYPNGAGFLGWTQAQLTDLFNWIKAMANTLQSAQPTWLGPLYEIPNSKSGFGMAWWGLNFTIAQWAWTANLANNPQYINQSMGTILLDEALFDHGPQLTGDYNKMVNQLWDTNKLNLWYYECSDQRQIGSAIWGGNDSAVANMFHITYSQGGTYNYTVLNGLSGVAGWIASGYGGTNYVIASTYYAGMYVAKSGFVNIANFTYDSPNRIAVGYYTNSSVGRFLLTHYPTQPVQGNFAPLLPRSMVNKMLYWVCNCPINSSQPLIDLTILNSGGTIIIPMTNQKNVGNSFGPSNMTGWSISSTLNINATALGLGLPSNYRVYWASSGTPVAVTNWSNVAITLNGMADALVIAPL
jgi:hypothetical protein